jgi:1-acyl-sn-glycerol-3-phosphate acyltransferase
VIFPEGGNTNGTALMKFKKGAFVSETVLKPVFVK